MRRNKLIEEADIEAEEIIETEIEFNSQYKELILSIDDNLEVEAEVEAVKALIKTNKSLNKNNINLNKKDNINKNRKILR